VTESQLGLNARRRRELIGLEDFIVEGANCVYSCH
jgi:hypothetical protein